MFDNNYTVEFDYTDINFLAFILEVTINRQLNYIAANKREINKIDEKLAELEKDMMVGKKGFFSNPKVKFEELTKKRWDLIQQNYEPQRDLETARAIYRRIVNESSLVDSNFYKLSVNEKLFEDRNDIHLYGPYKKYFKIEHHIY
jgi:hypothetical protein